MIPRPVGLAVALILAVPVLAGSSPALDSERIERLTGAKGKLDAREGVFKVSVPRSDLTPDVAGAHLTPPQGLTSWAAFQPAGERVMVMGDLVLQEEQVNPVMSVALDSGLEVTALHNHFLWDAPRIMFMHIGGMGDEAALAGAVGKLFAALRDTSGARSAASRPAIDPAATRLDTAKLEAILGAGGDLNAGVYKLVVGRRASMHGQAIGGSMGVNTWAAFAGSDAMAIVDGDVAMHEDELQGVLKALRKAGVDVVAIHNHMTSEEPRFVFLHYWGVGPAEELARAVRAALDLTRDP